jgi:CheY-like chemotaxis protein
MRVLVVEEQRTLAVVMSEAVRIARPGTEVRHTEDASCALRLARDGSFDVILVDYHMPGIQGDHLINAMRQVAPQARIIVTSCLYEDSSEIRRALRAGAETYLSKPFTLAAVREQLEELGTSLRAGAAGGVAA